jgi:virginiamycin B lyase
MALYPRPHLQTVAAFVRFVRYGFCMESGCPNTGKQPRMYPMRKCGLFLLLVLFASTVMAQTPEPTSGQAPVEEESEVVINPIVDNPVQLEITEWPVPWKDTRPRDPDVAPNGVIWLVGQGGDYAARFDPESKEFTRKVLPPGTGPHNLIIDRDGTLWIAGNRQAFIGKMNPYTGKLARFILPDETARDPHTLVFSGRDEIWFTMQWSNYVGRLNKRSGLMDLVPMQTDQARPYGIKMDSKGHPWIALLGTNGLATINPKTLELEVVYLPREEARLRRLAITDDNAIWYTDYSQGYIGRYDPQSGEFTEWKTPSEKSGPYAMAADNLGRVWFVETWPQPNLLVGFDPLFGTFFSVTPIPSGAGSVRHMVYDPARNSLWFGTDTNNLAQAVLP